MKVLVVVDMQKDFIDGSLGTPEAQAIVPNVCDAIEKYADPYTVIVFTKDTHTKDYMNTHEGKNLPVPHCIKGTDGHEIDPRVFAAYVDNKDKFANAFGDFGDNLIIEKPTFGSTDFQKFLTEIGTVEEVTLMGLCTGICVMSNAILAKATIPEATVNVVADCSACVTPASHQTALDAMKLCQINII